MLQDDLTGFTTKYADYCKLIIVCILFMAQILGVDKNCKLFGCKLMIDHGN